MKIDAYRTDISAEGLDRVGRPATVVGNRDAAAAITTEAAGDDLRVSNDARLMQAAMQSAQEAMNIRPEVVERMRAALANGTVGNDPYALADALIDRLSGASSQKLP